MNGRLFGSRMGRVEDTRLVTGSARFSASAADPSLVGAVWVGFVRSPVAHARIASIDVTAARRAPGCVAVFTGAEVGLAATPPWAAVDERFAQPLLARDVVRFAGEPVAIVAAESAAGLEDAVELVDVRYHPLPAVTDAVAAATDRELIFPDVGINTVCVWGPDVPDTHLFDGCDVVVSQEMINQRLAPTPMETRAAAAVWPRSGRLTIWMPSQGAHAARAALARTLDVDAAAVRVITQDVGGAFGAKERADPEYVLLAWVAHRLDRPARWVESRQENLVAMAHGRGQHQTVTIGGCRDGRILAYRLQILQDCGAYPRFGAIIPSLTRLMTPGPYAIAHAESTARCVVTTTTPVASYRGAGRPEAAAALERAVDLFAGEIGMDPALVRRRNLLAAFTTPRPNGFGATYDSGNYPAALDKALRVAGYERLRREQRSRREKRDRVVLGVGLASYVEISGGSQLSESATVEVHSNGTATVLSGTSPSGQGHATAWAMLAADELGIDPATITVAFGDTDLIPDGVGTFGSRSLQLGGVAVRQAARDVVQRAIDRAADLLEADPKDLSFDRARSAISVTGSPDTVVTLAAIAAQEPLMAHHVFTAAGPTFPFGTHLAVVEVDLDTGKPRLVRLVAVDDAGTILNPLLAQGQVLGGLAQGAGQALFEQVMYDHAGNPLAASLADYTIASAMDLPTFELASTVTPTDRNPLGAKGIGEAGVTGAAPAIQNAVIDALAHLGVRHIDMPTTPYRIWSAIHASESAIRAAEA